MIGAIGASATPAMLSQVHCLGKQPMPALPSSSLLFHGNIPFLNRSDKSLSSTTVRSNGSPKIISIDFSIDP